MPTIQTVTVEFGLSVRKDEQAEQRFPVGEGAVMRMGRGVLGAVLFLSAFGLVGPVGGQSPPSLPLLDGASSTDTLAATVRGYLVEYIPPVLLEHNRHWGQQ